MPAVGTSLDVANQSGSATGLDRRHNLELIKSQMPYMGSAIGMSDSPDDISHLDGVARRLIRLDPYAQPSLRAPYPSSSDIGLASSPANCGLDATSPYDDAPFVDVVRTNP